MLYRALYHPLVKEKDIPKLPKVIKERVKSVIEKRLLLEPEKYSKPLRKTLKDYRKTRIGDYRIILKVEYDNIFILGIRHRKDIYLKASKRV